MVSGPRTPSGLPNNYGDIKYRFPAASPLIDLDTLSEAMVCRTKYTMPTVIIDQDTLFASTDKQRDQYVTEWRENVKKRAFTVYLIVLTAKKKYYGAKSWSVVRETYTKGLEADTNTGEVHRDGYG